MVYLFFLAACSSYSICIKKSTNHAPAWCPGREGWCNSVLGSQTSPKYMSSHTSFICSSEVLQQQAYYFFHYYCTSELHIWCYRCTRLRRPRAMFRTSVTPYMHRDISLWYMFCAWYMVSKAIKLNLESSRLNNRGETACSRQLQQSFPDLNMNPGPSGR